MSNTRNKGEKLLETYTNLLYKINVFLISTDELTHFYLMYKHNFRTYTLIKKRLNFAK